MEIALLIVSIIFALVFIVSVVLLISSLREKKEFEQGTLPSLDELLDANPNPIEDNQNIKSTTSSAFAVEDGPLLPDDKYVDNVPGDSSLSEEELKSSTHSSNKRIFGKRNKDNKIETKNNTENINNVEDNSSISFDD